jgi:hypothetical protein
MLSNENLYPYLKEVICWQLLPIIVIEGKFPISILLFHDFRNFFYQYSFAGFAIIKKIMTCKNSKAKVSFP